jgi:hypothetical protein
MTENNIIRQHLIKWIHDACNVHEHLLVENKPYDSGVSVEIQNTQHLFDINDDDIFNQD